MKLVPVKYEQYQMLQMANYCYASLLEISKVDNFIKTVLFDLTIHLENYNDNGKLNLQQW